MRFGFVRWPEGWYLILFGDDENERFSAQLDPKGLLLRGADASDNYTSELPSAADAHLRFTVHCAATWQVVSGNCGCFVNITINTQAINGIVYLPLKLLSAEKQTVSNLQQHKCNFTSHASLFLFISEYGTSFYGVVSTKFLQSSQDRLCA